MYLRECINNILEKDPAAKSRLEVILCYPGFHVLFFHKFSHALWLKGFRTPARILSHLGRVVTGIEIHPGATIGRRVFIDHGMGVVIGETAVVGSDCVIYQGVTLGAGSAARQGALTRDVKRHPTLGQGVIVGSGAEIQGAINIGDNVRVASGSIVLKDVPDNSVVVGVPGRVIYQDGKKIPKEDVPDIEAEAIKALKEKIMDLEQIIKELKTSVKCQEKIIHRLKADSLNSNQDEASTGSSVDQNCLPSSDKKDPVDIFLKGAGI
jgi:serine O-acetyltransferase